MSNGDDIRRNALEERIRLARQDIDDLGEQVEIGEIGEATAAELEERYRADLAEAEAEMAGLPKPQRRKVAPKAPAKKAAPAPMDSAKGAGRPAWLIPVIAAAAMVVVTVVIVVLATGGEDPPAEAELTAPAGAQSGSLAELEAAVAAQPENNPMRLALADAYFEQGLYMEAMNHYSTITASNPTNSEAAIANARIGWMAWSALNEPDTALAFLDAAIELDPAYGEAVLWKGVVLLYGKEDGAAAIPLFEQVLQFPDLPDLLRPDIENMLAEARGGGR